VQHLKGRAPTKDPTGYIFIAAFAIMGINDDNIKEVQAGKDGAKFSRTARRLTPNY
jgi:hypothetical protein